MNGNIKIYEKLRNLAEKLLQVANNRNIKVCTAESCTGGLISSYITEVSGSSDVFERGFVTYSNEAKHELLGVPNEMLETYGAVSQEVAIAMAEGALANSNADISVAVTGVAGPTGGTEEKPVGLVHIATARKTGETIHEECHFDGDREEVRLATVERALEMLIEECE